MADRFLFKKFASETNDVGQFGSFQSTGGKVGDGVKTTDPDLIQSLPAWKAGWGNAVDNGLLLPRLEEMNGVQRVFAEMLWNQWRDGITFWQAGAPVKALQSVVIYQTGDEKPKLYINKTGVNGTNPPPQDTDNWEPLNNSGGGEIGDIGFAPLGIDESLNLRRYLNGQVISQSQFVSFTNKVKSAIALYPNLAATETNWQAEKTNSKLGQCGKFVVDDTAGTIRLPCVVNAQGLTDLQYLGAIKNESLPNITGSARLDNGFIGTYFDDATGAFYKGGTWTQSGQRGATGNADALYYSGLDASLSSSTYQDGAPVQQEAVQYPYYIQVATGVEETLPAIREYNINTPFFFGQSMYSDVAPDNASWLVSNGQWNAKSVYPDYYNWLLERMNNGVKGVLNSVMYAYSTSGSGIIFTLTTTDPKVGMTCYGWSDGSYANMPISTITSVNQDGTFVAAFNGTDYTFERNSAKDQSQSYPTDYDFVINTTDQTFRLPLLNGEENIPDYNNRESCTSGTPYTASKRGFFYGYSRLYEGNKAWVTINGVNQTLYAGAYDVTGHTTNGSFYFEIGVGDSYSAVISAGAGYFAPAKGNGTLYFYVGDTVQDASLINAGAVLGQLANVNAASRGYVVESYHNGAVWYRIYSDGWCEQGFPDATNQDHFVTLLVPMANADYTVSIGQSGSGASGQVGRSTWKEKTATTLKINSVTLTDWVIAGYKA